MSWIDEAQPFEPAAEKPTIAHKEGVCLELGVGANEEVGHDAVPVATAYRQAILPPELSCQLGRFLPQRLVHHAERCERGAELSFLREMGAHLTPNDVTGYESTRVVSSAKGLS
jgi:hypothetical protein